MINLLLNAHESVQLSVVLFLQILFAYFMVHFVADNPSLTPVPPAGRFSQPLHFVCRLIAALAWMAIMVGAAMSLAGIFYRVADGRDVLGSALNDFGVAISRTAGPVIMFHVMGMAWRFVLLEAACRKQASRQPR